MNEALENLDFFLEPSLSQNGHGIMGKFAQQKNGSTNANKKKNDIV